MSEYILNNESSLEPQVPSVLPLLALRDVVVYPHMQIALFVGRENRSMQWMWLVTVTI